MPSRLHVPLVASLALSLSCLAVLAACGSTTPSASAGSPSGGSPSPVGSTSAASPPAAPGGTVPGSCHAIASLVGSYIGGVGTAKSLGAPQHLSCEFENAAATRIAIVDIGADGTAAAFAGLRATSAQGGRTVTSISGLGSEAFSVSKNGVPAGVSALTAQGLVYVVETNLPVARDEALIRQLMALS